MLPEFSFHFGIQPWQVADLTFGEIEDYLSALKQIRNAQPKGGARG